MENALYYTIVSKDDVALAHGEASSLPAALNWCARAMAGFEDNADQVGIFRIEDFEHLADLTGPKVVALQGWWRSDSVWERADSHAMRTEFPEQLGFREVAELPEARGSVARATEAIALLSETIRDLKDVLRTLPAQS